MEAVARGDARVTPPFKPYLEEKLWFALFWMRPLREFWRRELSERHFLELQKHIPYTWILDPTPLPQHAVIPGLEINRWEELKHFSPEAARPDPEDQRLLRTRLGQPQRRPRLRLLPAANGRPRSHDALAAFPHHPYILQRFHKGRLVEQPFLDPDDRRRSQTMHGRVRLCPYYFVDRRKAELRGALATICPPDKKLLHGMKDAIMVPTAVAG